MYRCYRFKKKKVKGDVLTCQGRQLQRSTSIEHFTICKAPSSVLTHLNLDEGVPSLWTRSSGLQRGGRFECPVLSKTCCRQRKIRTCSSGIRQESLLPLRCKESSRPRREPPTHEPWEGLASPVEEETRISSSHRMGGPEGALATLHPTLLPLQERKPSLRGTGAHDRWLLYSYSCQRQFLCIL